MRIDAHQHFWRYTPEEYGWIDDSLAKLRRDFLPKDLQPELAAAGLDAAIAVQARQSLEETDFLLGLARQSSTCCGVVGWVPLISQELPKILERFAADPLFLGVRHVLQDEADAAYMLREDFQRGIGELKAHGLVYDILIRETQLKQVSTFVDRHPEQPFVLDHLAKPAVKAGTIDTWARELRELARREQVHCKLSGLVTEADFAHWKEAQLQPYVEAALEAFGPKRLLFGSDWPVCLAATNYGTWRSVVDRLLKTLSADEQAGIMGNNAVRIYRIRPELWPSSAP
jgi:L-fuconolactonase